MQPEPDTEPNPRFAQMPQSMGCCEPDFTDPAEPDPEPSPLFAQMRKGLMCEITRVSYCVQAEPDPEPKPRFAQMPQSPEEIKEKEEARAWSAVADVPVQEATPSAPSAGQVSPDTKTSPEAETAPPAPTPPQDEIVEPPTEEEAESPKVHARL